MPVASFTFDDFPVSAWEVGGRILREKAGALGTYFVSGTFMGREIGGVQYYTAGNLRAVLAAGNEVGCHTFAHQKLGAGGADFARKTCEENARFMQDILGQDFRFRSFAYPYGDSSIAVKNRLSKMFPLCRGVQQRINAENVDCGQIGVTSLEIRHAGQVDLPRIVAEARARKGWLVFLTHDIGENPSPYGSTPAMLEEAVGLVQAAGFRILPVTQAASLGLDVTTRV